MPSDHPSVRTAFYWVATAVVGLNLPVTIADVAAHPDAYRPGFAVSVLVAFGVLTAVAAWRATLGYGAGTVLRTVVVLAYLALAVHPWMLTGPTDYPPLLHVLGAGMSITAILSVRGSLVMIPAFAWGVAALRAPEIGPWQAGTDATLLAMGGLVGTACVDVFARAARSVNVAVGRSWQAAEEQARIAARSGARDRWDGLIHDTVLGALAVAARGPAGPVDVAARQLAEAALTALRGATDVGEDSLVSAWRRHAEMLGLRPRFRVHGELEVPVVRDALVGAVNEALTNVARHSGQRAVTVSGSVSSAHARIAISDPGRGFDPARARRRFGIGTSVIARMRAIGGDATVRSVPGDGTRVVLSWQQVLAVPARAGSAWELRSFVPMTLVAAGVLAATLVSSYPQWSSARLPVLSVVVIAAVLVVSAGAVFAEPSRRTGAVLVTAVVILAAAGLANTPVDAVIDWRYWYLSALTPAVSILTFRFGAGLGAAAVGATTLVVVGLDLAAGRSVLDALSQAVPVLVATALAARLIRAALAEAWDLVEETTRRTAELRRALATEAEREAETETRVEALADEVEPFLSLIAAGGPLTAEQVREAEHLGSAVRDQLAAPDLLDARLVRALRAARARGAVVDIVTATDQPATMTRHECEVCRSVLTAVVERASAGQRFRVSWASTDGLVGTIAAVGGDTSGLAAVVRSVASEDPRVRVTHDEEAVLVEFAAE